MFNFLTKKTDSNLNNSTIQQNFEFTDFIDYFVLDFDNEDHNLDVKILNNSVPADIFKHRNLADLFYEKGFVISLDKNSNPQHVNPKFTAAIVVSKETSGIGKNKDERNIYFIFKNRYSFSIAVKSTVTSQYLTTKIDAIRLEFKTFLNSVFKYMSSLLVTIPKLENLEIDFNNITKLINKTDNPFIIDIYKSISIILIDRMKEIETTKLIEDCELKYHKYSKFINSF